MNVGSRVAGGDGEASEARKRAKGDRPALLPISTERIDVPARWPEAAAYRAGRRLAQAEADEVPTLLHERLPIGYYLSDDELAAQLHLAHDDFERWLRYGWTTAIDDQEEG